MCNKTSSDNMTGNPYSILARLQQLPMDPKSVHDIIPSSKKRTRRRGRRGGKHHRTHATEQRQEEEYGIHSVGGSRKHTSEHHLNDEEVQAKQQIDHIASASSAKYSSVFPREEGYYSWAPQLRPNKLTASHTALHNLRADEGSSPGPATPHVEHNLYPSNGFSRLGERDLNGNHTSQSLFPGAASIQTQRLEPETHLGSLLTQRPREVAISTVHYRAKLREKKHASLFNLSSSTNEATNAPFSATLQSYAFPDAPDTTISPRAMISLSTASDKTPSLKTLYLDQDSPIIFVPPTPTPTSVFSPLNTGLQATAPSQRCPPYRSCYKSSTASGINISDSMNLAEPYHSILTINIGAHSMTCCSLPKRNSMHIASKSFTNQPLFPTRLIRRKLPIGPPTSKELQELESFLNCGHGNPCWCGRHISTPATPSSSGNSIGLSESISSQQTPTTSITDLDKSLGVNMIASVDEILCGVGNIISSPSSLGLPSPFDDFDDFLHPSESESDEWTIVPSDAQNEPFHTRSFHDTTEDDDGGILSPSSYLLSPVLKCSEAEP